MKGTQEAEWIASEIEELVNLIIKEGASDLHKSGHRPRGVGGETAIRRLAEGMEHPTWQVFPRSPSYCLLRSKS